MLLANFDSASNVKVGEPLSVLQRHDIKRLALEIKRLFLPFLAFSCLFVFLHSFLFLVRLSASVSIWFSF